MKTSETEKKLEFLDKLLEKNPNLQQQFVEYMQDTENLSDDDPSENIVQMARELAKELEALDLDNPDWGITHPGIVAILKSGKRTCTWPKIG
jgi:hypothetical protein